MKGAQQVETHVRMTSKNSNLKAFLLPSRVTVKMFGSPFFTAVTVELSGMMFSAFCGIIM